MARILMVSKPVTPPWNDSSKNLVRDIASQMSRHQPTVLTKRGVHTEPPGVRQEAVYGPVTAGFAPALLDNARVLVRLMAGRSHDLWHFFFAPNRTTSRAGAVASALRRVPTVQTVCSAPAAGANLPDLLFADRTIVLSRHTEQLMLAAGCAPESVRRIPPAVSPLDPLDDAERRAVRVELGLPTDRTLLLYPGDLEFSRAAENTLRAVARLDGSCALVLACREKTPRARLERERLRRLVSELGLTAQVTFVGETRRIHDLLGASDVVVLPAENLYAKMDLPLVLIEAMWLARPIVVARGTPAAELVEDGAGLAVPPEVEALAEVLGGLVAVPDQRTALGARARERADRYHPARVASAYEALYDELLS
jgi:phosphatidylinositol alpha-1,6-mannosyltransferase